MADRILVVDDEPDQCTALVTSLEGLGYEVDGTTDPRVALEMARRTSYKLVLTDLEMPSWSGVELCATLCGEQPALPIIVITGRGTLDNVSAAFRAGAYDYLCKPVEPSQLTVRVTRAVAHGDLQQQLARAHSGAAVHEPAPMLGNSARMRNVRRLLGQVAACDASLLIQGESGTGKDLFARAVHAQSVRAKGPFVVVECAAIPEALFESELFGHVRGAFTDAKDEREGLFVRARGGTIFLDEIAELPLLLQTKLLRVLQERRVRPVGAEHEVDIDVRVIAATHRPLERAVAEGAFRDDLFYRIQIIHVELPPLRERSDEILGLALHFLKRAAESDGRAAKRLSARAAEALWRHDYPGNVRELENAMQRAHAIGRYDHVVVEDLPEVMRPVGRIAASVDTILTLDEVQRRHVRRVMSQVHGNKSKAAFLLRVDRRTLGRKMEEPASPRGASTVVHKNAGA